MAQVLVVGAINWDINLFVGSFPQVGEEVPVKRITRGPGGKAANVAVAAARMLGPTRVALVGALGLDEIAEKQIDILGREGVETSGIRRVEDAESGQAYILVDQDGRNMIHTFFGANLGISPQDLLEPRRLSLMKESPLITVMDPPIETAEAAVTLGKENGKTVLWDPGVRCALGLERLAEPLQNVDYLIVNEVEIGNLTGKEDLTNAGDGLLKLNGLMTIVVKLGARGCLVISKQGRKHIPGVDLEMLGLKAINTVGCGDAFLGVFSALKTEGAPDAEALEKANAAGAFKATKAQTRGSPMKKELEEFLQRTSSTFNKNIK